ncbi:MAG: hypothetical protein AAF934_07110 [Bacteroidota bacterium]
MHEVEDYRPNVMAFNVEANDVPQSLGKFKSDEEARSFMTGNLSAVPTTHTGERYIDQVEIGILRDRYIEELEDILPGLRTAYSKKVSALKAAQQDEKNAGEAIKVSLNRIQQMADKVNKGVTEVVLDETHTWEVIYNGKKYCYTYIDEEIKLAGVQDMSSHETEYHTDDKNKVFFEQLKQLEDH